MGNPHARRLLHFLAAAVLVLAGASATLAQETACEAVPPEATPEDLVEQIVLHYRGDRLEETEAADGALAFTVPNGAELWAWMDGGIVSPRLVADSATQASTSMLTIRYAGRITNFANPEDVQLTVRDVITAHAPDIAAPLRAQLDAEAAQIEAALRAWKRQLTREEKNEIARIGVATVEITDPFEGLAYYQAEPAYVSAHGSVLDPVDERLYNAGRMLWKRLTQLEILQGDIARAEAEAATNLAAYEPIAKLPGLLVAASTPLRVFIGNFTEAEANSVHLAELERQVTMLSGQLASARTRLEQVRAPFLATIAGLEERLKQRIADYVANGISAEQAENQKTVKDLRASIAAETARMNAASAEPERVVAQLTTELAAKEEETRHFRDSVAAWYSSSEAEWAAVYTAFDAAQSAMTEAGRALPRLGPLVPTMHSADLQRIGGVLAALDRAAVTLGAETARLEAALDRHRQTIDRLDRSYTHLAIVANSARYTAGCAAAEEMAKLNEPAFAPFLAELTLLNEATEKLHEMFANLEGKVDKLIEYIGEDRAKKLMLDRLSKRIGLFAKTLEKIHEIGTAAKDLDDFIARLRNGDPTVLVDILKAMATIAEDIPVIGPVVSEVMTFYAETAAKIIADGQRIQKYLVDQDIQLNFSGNQGPERFLYSRANVVDALTRNLDDRALAKVVVGLQVTRVMSLLKGGRLGGDRP